MTRDIINELSPFSPLFLENLHYPMILKSPRHYERSEIYL